MTDNNYIKLLVMLFQSGQALDAIDTSGIGRDSMSPELKRFYEASDIALEKVDTELLYEKAEELDIPEKYPDFYEYLETLQKQKEEDVERTPPDNTKDVSEPDTEVEEPVHEETSADLKEQVTKNLVEGEHTGNKRDSEAYRKGDEFREQLNEERREALRSYQQDSYEAIGQKEVDACKQYQQEGNSEVKKAASDVYVNVEQGETVASGKNNAEAPKTEPSHTTITGTLNAKKEIPDSYASAGQRETVIPAREDIEFHQKDAAVQEQKQAHATIITGTHDAKKEIPDSYANAGQREAVVPGREDIEFHQKDAAVQEQKPAHTTITDTLDAKKEMPDSYASAVQRETVVPERELVGSQKNVVAPEQKPVHTTITDTLDAKKEMPDSYTSAGQRETVAQEQELVGSQKNVIAQERKPEPTKITGTSDVRKEVPDSYANAGQRETVAPGREHVEPQKDVAAPEQKPEPTKITGTYDTKKEIPDSYTSAGQREAVVPGREHAESQQDGVAPERNPSHTTITGTHDVKKEIPDSYANAGQRETVVPERELVGSQKNVVAPERKPAHTTITGTSDVRKEVPDSYASAGQRETVVSAREHVEPQNDGATPEQKPEHTTITGTHDVKKEVPDSYISAGQRETVISSFKNDKSNIQTDIQQKRPTTNFSGGKSEHIIQSDSKREIADSYSAAGQRETSPVSHPESQTIKAQKETVSQRMNVGIYGIKQGNTVSLKINDRNKQFTIRSDGTIFANGVTLNIYSEQQKTGNSQHVFIGWKNIPASKINYEKLNKTGIKFTTTKSTEKTVTKSEMSMSYASAIKGISIDENDFSKVNATSFATSNFVDGHIPQKTAKMLKKGEIENALLKQRSMLSVALQNEAMASLYKSMKEMNSMEYVGIMTTKYDKILATISSNANHMCTINRFFESKYLDKAEQKQLKEKRKKLSELKITQNVDKLRQLLEEDSLNDVKKSAATEYIQLYESTRRKIITKGILSTSDKSIIGQKTEHAFYAASIPYILQEKGLPVKKSELKKLLKLKTLTTEQKKLIKNALKLKRRLKILHFSKSLAITIAEANIKATKAGIKYTYRTAKQTINKYMGNDYTMRGFLMAGNIASSILKAPANAYKLRKKALSTIQNTVATVKKAEKGTKLVLTKGRKAVATTVRIGRTAKKKGLKNTAKAGGRRIKGFFAKRNGVLKTTTRFTKKAALTFLKSIVRILQLITTALLSVLGPVIGAIIILVLIIFSIMSFITSSGDKVYYDAGDEDTSTAVQEMVDLLTLCHASFRTALTNQFGGGVTSFASGTDDSGMNAPQLQKGDTSKVFGLYDVQQGTWWNYEFSYQYIHGKWAAGTRQRALDEMFTNGNLSISGNGNYAFVNNKMYMAAFGTYWGKVGDVLKVQFNTTIQIGDQPATDTLYIIICDVKAWQDTGYPQQKEGIYGHNLGGHRDFAEFMGYDGQPAGLNGQGIVPMSVTNLGSLLENTCDLNTVGNGSGSASVSSNADIFYRQEIDQDTYREILDRTNNVYYTFPKEQDPPDGITPTPTPVGYDKSTDTGEVYGFYNNDQELISMVLAMFDFDINTSTSVKQTIIATKDESGKNSSTADASFQTGITDKINDDTWSLIAYLTENGLDLTNYKEGGYDDLKYSTLIGLFNASHIVTGTPVKQYHKGPDGTINPTYQDGRIVGQNNTDGMSYQVPVIETTYEQVENEDGTYSVIPNTHIKRDADGDIVYETKYRACPGHTKYSAAVITLHFDSLLNLKQWWNDNIYSVDDFDKENPNYSTNDITKKDAENYRAKETVLKRTFQYIKKPDYYKELDGTCEEGSNTSFSPGTMSESQQEVARQCYSYLTSEIGLTDAQAIGLMVNILKESGFDYTAVQAGNGEGYGLCQWSFSRKTRLMSWCAANSYSYNTLEGQLAYLKAEFTVYTDAWAGNGVNGFLQCQTEREAGEYALRYFEQPDALEIIKRSNSMENDIATVKQYLN